MLGKQSWKLDFDQNALVSRIFKAAQDVVRIGMRWRVRSGSKINLWRDPWLKDKDSSFIRRVVPPGLENYTVADVIEGNTGGY